MKTLNTWKIAYTITEGEHEYGDYITRELAATALDERAAAALVADRWLTEEDGPEERKRFLRELLKPAGPSSPVAAAPSASSAGKRSRRSPSR